MKKNMLSIIILALLVVNLILTSIMMFSVMTTNQKTGAVVSDVASILQLELGEGTEEEASAAVSMEDTAVYDIEDEMTIQLAAGEDGSVNYALVQVSFSMNTKDEGYATYGETIDEKVNLIKDEIREVFGQYTAEEVLPRTEDIKEEILSRIQEMFGSEFIYKITFSELIVQ